MNASDITHGLKVIGGGRSMATGVVVLMVFAVIGYLLWSDWKRRSEPHIFRP